MTNEVWTNRQALRRLAAVTAISVVLSVLMTCLAMTYVFGVDPESTIAVSLAFKFGIVIAVVAPVLICPVISYKIVRTIRDRDRAHLELRRIAETDQLTGLLNRRGFTTAAMTAMSGSNAANPAISALMIDIDFFKKINDGFGHDFGDAVIVRVAAILRGMAQSHGLVAGRQGGEEFIALLPGVAETEAVAVAERLREACSATAIEHKGRSTSIAVSIGVSSRRQPVALPQLLSEADNAPYRAKRNGRDRVVLYRPALALERVA